MKIKYSQKLSYIAIERLKGERCCRAATNLLVYLSHYLDELGQCRDIYYRAVCDDIGITPKTFYAVLRLLAKKDIIRVEWVKRRYINIVILDNVFRNIDNRPVKEDYRKGYVNTNFDFMHTGEFYCLKANEKILLLELMKKQLTRGKMYHLTGKQIMALVGIGTRKLLPRYIQSLRKWLRIDFVKGVYHFSMLDTARQKGNSERTVMIQHKIEKLCRVHSVEYTFYELTDTLRIFNRHKEHDGLLIRILTDTIMKKKRLQPALIESHYQYAIKKAKRAEQEEARKKRIEFERQLLDSSKFDF